MGTLTNNEINLPSDVVKICVFFLVCVSSVCSCIVSVEHTCVVILVTYGLRPVETHTYNIVYCIQHIHSVNSLGEREREKERETDRQTDRQTDRDRHRERQRQRQRETETERDRERERKKKHKKTRT